MWVLLDDLRKRTWHWERDDLPTESTLKIRPMETNARCPLLGTVYGKSSLNEYWLTYHQKRASQVALGVKNPPANAGDIRHIGSIPQSGRSLKKGMATHSSILAWRISWTEKPSGLQFMGSQRARHDWGQSACMQQSVSSTELLLWFILLPYSDSRLTRGFWMSAFHAGKEC